jgi:hypothetical protein
MVSLDTDPVVLQAVPLVLLCWRSTAREPMAIDRPSSRSAAAFDADFLH